MWKRIKGYNQYLINEDGIVVNDKGIKISVYVNYHGYYTLSLVNDEGIRKTVRLHRLLAENFIPNYNNWETVNHIDGNKLNNKLSNLEWMTHSENARLGNNIPVIQLDYFGNVINEYPSAKDASAKTGIDYTNILRSCHTHYKAGGYKWEQIGGGQN